MRLAKTLAVLAGAALAAPLCVHALAAARAAAEKRRARAACPFEDDDHDTLPAGRIVQLVVAESLLWLYALLTMAFPPAEDTGAPAGIPVVVLPPRWLPRSAVRTLVARLRADGYAVVCPRLGPWPRDHVRRTALVDRVLRTTWERHGTRAVDVIAAAASVPDVVAHLAAGGSGTPAVRRLVTLGARGAAGPRVPAGTEVIALYSQDDPLLGPVEQARRPEAFNVALRGVGRLGLLHAPHVYALVREHLAAPAPASAPPWIATASS